VNSGATFTRVTTVQSALQVGFGMAASSQTYPAIFIVGTINGVYGFFQSDDQGGTWTRINDDNHQYAAIYCITGDERMYGRVYVGTGGRGTVYADPVSPAPELLQFSTNGHTLYLQYQSEPGFDYVLMRAASLSTNGGSNIWSDVITNIGTGGVLSFSNDLNGEQQFFRVRAQLPQ
jgi:hypothetical protein